MPLIPTVLTKLIKVTIPTADSGLGKHVCLYFSGSKANSFNPLRKTDRLRVTQRFQEIATAFHMKFFPWLFFQGRDFQLSRETQAAPQREMGK